MSPLLKDRISGVVLFSLAVFIWIVIPYQIEDPGITAMGPRFFPRFLSIALMILSGLLVVRSFVGKRKEVKEKEGEKKASFKLTDELRVVLVFAILIVYVSIMERLGFVLSTILAMGVVMYLLKVRKLYYYGIFIGVTVVIYYVFEKLMYVQLP